MTFIDQDPPELTTKRGCFNCKTFNICPYIREEERKGRDFMEILIEKGENIEYRYGCCCDDWKFTFEKEIVQFS